MSTQDGWDGWDGWDGGNAGRGGGTALATERTREALVIGIPTDTALAALDRPDGWPGTRADDALAGLAANPRQQVIVMDLIQGLSLVPRSATALNVVVNDSGASHPLTAPAAEAFRDELAQVELAADLRAERAAEIQAQLTFNPAFWANILPLSGRRTPRTLELMRVVVSYGSFVVQRAKVMLNLPRPHELSPRIHPMVPTPGFSTYPSGHATESQLVSRVLFHLVKSTQTAHKVDPKTGALSAAADAWLKAIEPMLGDLAHRIGENREVAGLHFPVDSKDGRELADFLVRAHLVPLAQTANRAAGAEGATTTMSPQPPSPFAWLWAQAAKEWGAP
ncbi:hypothetical protein [Ideonella sp. A 288]|uniref:hypothetical protein n=1 Tax=Ideonella sp. A 288 TaxID=1962181 RepID=UPI000B4AB033|nr:hypothetical protein [Ideonella sp. A 288]